MQAELARYNEKEAIRAVFGDLEELNPPPTVEDLVPDAEEEVKQFFGGLLEGPTTKTQANLMATVMFPHQQTIVDAFDPHFPYVRFLQSLGPFRGMETYFPGVGNSTIEYARTDGGILVKRQALAYDKSVYLSWEKADEERVATIGHAEHPHLAEVAIMKAAHQANEVVSTKSATIAIGAAGMVNVTFQGDTVGSFEKLERTMKALRAEGKDLFDATPIIHDMEFELDPHGNVTVSYLVNTARRFATEVRRSVTIRFGQVQPLEDTPFVIGAKKEHGVISLGRINTLTNTTWRLNFSDNHTYVGIAGLLTGEKERWSAFPQLLPSELVITEPPLEE